MLGLAMLTTNSREQKPWYRHVKGIPGLLATLVNKTTSPVAPRATTGSSASHCPCVPQSLIDEQPSQSAPLPHISEITFQNNHPHNHNMPQNDVIESLHTQPVVQQPQAHISPIASHDVTIITSPAHSDGEQATFQQPREEFDLLSDCVSLPQTQNLYLHDTQKIDLLTPGKIDCLLPPKYSPLKKTLVLDLDETLMHSSVEPLPHTDFRFEVTVEGVTATIYIVKRPGVEEFLSALKDKFEIVVFTASIPEYADKVIDYLDTNRSVSSRLYRSSCTQLFGSYVKDLDKLGRDLSNTIIIDNTPASYALHPQNAIPISSFITNPNDTELMSLAPLLCELSVYDGDVRKFISDRITNPTCNLISFTPNNNTTTTPLAQSCIAATNNNNNNNNTQIPNTHTTTTTSTATTTSVTPWFFNPLQQTALIPLDESDDDDDDTR
ncbi:NLI interacting factor [Pelomyxa schiedti]|nr:NLI interacting factor [Pelomyxa schiedti]